MKTRVMDARRKLMEAFINGYGLTHFGISNCILYSILFIFVTGIVLCEFPTNNESIVIIFLLLF